MYNKMRWKQNNFRDKYQDYRTKSPSYRDNPNNKKHTINKSSQITN